VKFPWKLSISTHPRNGEGLWIHNQARIEIGSDVVVSQESFLTTGTHAFREDMALQTLPVTIENGAWIPSRCIVLAGSSQIRRSAVILPNTVVRGEVPGGTLFGTPSGQVVGQRFAEPPVLDASGTPPLSSPSTQARYASSAASSLSCVLA
jgi:putative colanic acid biosynthesis acetyltransferase WcaF